MYIASLSRQIHCNEKPPYLTVRGTKFTARPSSHPSCNTLSALRGVWFVHSAADTHSVRKYVTGSSAMWRLEAPRVGAPYWEGMTLVAAFRPAGGAKAPTPDAARRRRGANWVGGSIVDRLRAGRRMEAK